MLGRVVIVLVVGALASACAQSAATPPTAAVTPKARIRSDCAQKTSCFQMASCSEAVYRLVTCGQYHLPRNESGVPCERLCGKTLDDMRARMKAAPYTPK